MSAGKLTHLTPINQSRRSAKSSRVEGSDSPLSADLELLAHWSDTVFRIPGLGMRFGLDAILGLIPGVGDVTTSVASLYILSAANRYRVPRVTLMRMALNVVLDTIIGAIPLLGDVFDVYWKSNRRNVELLRRHLAAPPADARKMERHDRWFVLAIMIALAALMIGAALAAYWIIAWLVTAIGRAIG